MYNTNGKKLCWLVTSTQRYPTLSISKVRFDFPIVLWPKYCQSFRLSQTTSQKSCLNLGKTIQFFVYPIIGTLKKCFNPSQFMFWRYKSTFSDQTILQKNWLIKFFRKKYFNNNPCQTLFWRKEHTFQIKQFYKKKLSFNFIDEIILQRMVSIICVPELNEPISVKGK